MAKGISLHIGVNEVDPGHYAGWSGELQACEADAASMEAIARAQGFEPKVLLTRQATRQAVVDALRKAAGLLAAGDILMVTYAGHGGQVPDANGDEPDATDETWCLYDGELIDDELHALWCGFAAGVRVLAVSDSCHSGTVTRAAKGGLDIKAATEALKAMGIAEPRFRFMPPKAARDTYMANRAFYNDLGRSIPVESDAAPKASVRLLSGCQDEQTSADGPFNGLFTSKLLQVWNDGAFKGDYTAFHKAIVAQMPPTQQPNHFVIGPPLPAFDRQSPFAIGA